MKTQVLKIQLNNDANSLSTYVLIGNDKHEFTFSRKFNTIANKQLQVINHDKSFGDIFKYNHHIINEVINIVRKFFQGENPTLPQYVGDFGTPEDALKLQKPFYKLP
ncbi:hypothetical protein NIES4071_59230 [Calothrix sp. NIES-4071]|nr:hypothetical protein NIES4071_59230 [Calothrix sp. NIES-4071]BAZ60230.1 hypothetical protein NIES4105_59180 [Calothrix sp. NIES-4105]